MLTLFSIYANNLVWEFNDVCITMYGSISLTMYADDIDLDAESEKNLQTTSHAIKLILIHGFAHVTIILISHS